MPIPIDSSVLRRPDGSIDIEHYVAVARRARADEGRAVPRPIRAAFQNLVLTPGQSRPAIGTTATAAVGTQGD